MTTAEINAYLDTYKTLTLAHRATLAAALASGKLVVCPDCKWMVSADETSCDICDGERIDRAVALAEEWSWARAEMGGRW